MYSLHLSKKPEAIRLRKEGKSVRFIETRLGVPKSTLHGWFKDIILTREQQMILKQSWETGLKNARQKAVIWHNKQKVKRIELAQNQALTVLEEIGNDAASLELALAMLYLGEGAKKLRFSIGNSNPTILQFFLTAIKKLYNISPEDIRCDLNLRADQNPEYIKKYWSNQLKIPIKNFKSVSIDKRTHGSKTYADYKGVCQLRCPGLSYQRRLLFLAQLYCDKVIKT